MQDLETQMKPTYVKLDDLSTSQLLALNGHFVQKNVKKFNTKGDALKTVRASIQNCLDAGWTNQNVHDAGLNWASETGFMKQPAGLEILWQEGQEPPEPPTAEEEAAAGPPPPSPVKAKAKAATMPATEKRAPPPREPKVKDGTILKTGPNTRKGKIEAFQAILGNKPFKIEDGAKTIAEKFKPSRAEEITEGAARSYLSRGLSEGWWVTA